MSPRCNSIRCSLMFLPVLAAMVLLTGRCRGSDDSVQNGTTIATTTVTSTTELLLSSLPPSSTTATVKYPVAALSPLPLSANETAGKPSKFDEHVEDWQYVDDPLKNVTTAQPVAGQRQLQQLSAAAGNSSATGPVACKMCLAQSKSKTRRNKRNHDVRLFKLVNGKPAGRHRELYAELMVAAASKQAYRRKRFRRSATGAANAANGMAADSLDVASAAAGVDDDDAGTSAAHKQLFRYKRFRRSSTAADSTASEQLYRRKRFRRSTIAAYPNGMIRPYHHHNVHQQQQQQFRRFRYANDPYHYKRNGAATAWDRSADFRRRYLRFPPTHDSPPPSFNNIIANSNPWSPGPSALGAGLPSPLSVPQLAPQPFTYLPQYPVQQQQQSALPPQPAMGPRSPRLVFRDPVDQGTLQAPYGPNGLQDLLQVPPSNDEIQGCGVSVAKQQGAQRRIVGGDEAGFGSFPWQAYIRIGSSRCGGSLVNRYHVVTAGHCVARASARQVQVTLGDYVINSAVEPLPAYTFGVRKISVHPFFKFTPQADRFDVAVLKLDRPVQYMPHIAPICLPDKGEDFLGHYGWAAGWGALQAGSRLRPKTLQAVDVPIIDNRQCERWHKSNGINVIIYDEMMCAGYREGSKDSCQGDSGGPLMLEKTGRWYLIGIVSAGYSCAQRGQPGIYHRVALTVDWISYIINSS